MGAMFMDLMNNKQGISGLLVMENWELLQAVKIYSQDKTIALIRFSKRGMSVQMKMWCWLVIIHCSWDSIIEFAMNCLEEILRSTIKCFFKQPDTGWLASSKRFLSRTSYQLCWEDLDTDKLSGSIEGTIQT